MSGRGGNKRDAVDDYQSERKIRRSENNGCSFASFASFAFCKAYEDSTAWRGNVSAKLDAAAPYNFFLSRVIGIPETYDEDLTISFPELLDPSLGDIEHSVHVNFMVEIPWLLAQYAVVGIRNPSMTILYGIPDDDLVNLPAHLRLTACHIKMPSPFGHHHTKMSVFFYKDKSVRFIISTANLVETDWENRTQGVWISPRCPPLNDDAAINEGESETLFKCDIIQYLNSYHLEQLKPWLKQLQRTNMESIKVFLVASVPGTENSDRWGRKRLCRLIRRNVSSPRVKDWRIIVQCSSIGSLGPSAETWLTGPFGRSLQEKPSPAPAPIDVIYPSVQNVKDSLDGMLGGACLPYSSPTHNKQEWLKSHLKQWKSSVRLRNRAVPHIKSYCKVSPDGKELAWFLLTSANLSKAAWGMPIKNGDKIMSNELGVLFLPSIMIGKDTFVVKRNGSFKNPSEFSMPYDLPVTDYRSTDKVFLYDICYSNTR